MQSATEKISLSMAIIAGINAMVGASIFINPAALATHVGPAAIITFMIVTALVCTMALGLARVAAKIHTKSPFYTFAAQWGGHYAGVIATVAYTIGLCVAMSILTKLTGAYVYTYLHHSVSWLSATAWMMITLWALVAANCIGGALNSIGQLILVILTFIPIIMIMGICAANAKIANMTPFMPQGISSLFTAIKTVIFGFFGFETATTLYPIVQNPERTVPKAVILTTLLVGILYTAFIGCIFLGIPQTTFVSDTMPLSAALAFLLPSNAWIADLIGWGIIITIMGTLHSLIWALSNLLSESIQRIIPSYRLNARQAAITVGIIVTLLCIFISNLELSFALAALLLSTAYAMALVAIFVPDATGKLTMYDCVLGICSIVCVGILFGCSLQALVS